MATAYYRDMTAAVLVFDVTRKETFERVTQGWLDEINRNWPAGGAELLLLGNKVDLLDGDADAAVDEETVRAFAEANNMLYALVSAKTGKNVDKAFNQLVHKAVDRKIANESGRAAAAAAGDAAPASDTIKVQPESAAEQQQKKKKACAC